MADKPKDVEKIYSAALRRSFGQERSSFLDEVCAGDHALRARVEALLDVSQEVGDFLEVPAVDSNVSLDDFSSIEGPGTEIGNYELLELIGEGGMGLVYLAKQKEHVKRKVAFKIVKLGMDTKQVVARFEAERQTLALLEHPNLAHVFDAGTTEAGRPYFVMEYVEGKSITKYCDEHELSVEERLGLFRQLCEGVHHAHQKGIIHRDIKPSNILVSIHGDRVVPKIIDFGIAKAITSTLTENTSFTEHGQLLGTPEYMSPEQAEMAHQDVDTRSDIYSLGVLLYELLAGVTPFDANRLRKGGIDHIQQVICEEEPRTPSARLTSLGDKAKSVAESRKTQIVTLTRRLQRELEWIPMKAMRKDRTRRYRSASELADDIQNYLTGAPLIAGPESTVYRARKFVRKHAGSVATAALVAVLIILGLIISTALSFRAEKARGEEAAARTQAEQAHAQAEQAREKEVAARTQVEQALLRAESAEITAREQAEKYLRLSYNYGIALADVKYRDKNPRVAQKLLESCPKNLRNWEWHRLNHALNRATHNFNCHPYLLSIALSPDGNLIAATGVDSSQENWQHRISIWDANTGAKIRTLDGFSKKLFLSVAFSPDGNHVAASAIDNSVRVWITATGEEIMNYQSHTARVNSVHFTADGSQIISGGNDNTIRIWEFVTGEAEVTVREGTQVLAVSSNGEHALFRSKQNVMEFKVATGEVLDSAQLSEEGVSCASYSPDDKRIALGYNNGMIKILHAKTGEEIVASPGQGRMVTSRINSIAFSPDGTQIASGSSDQTVRIWDAATGAEQAVLIGHKNKISEVVYGPDGSQIVTSSYNGEIKKWDADSREMILKGHLSSVRDISFSPDGSKLISGGEDKLAKVWDVITTQEIHTLQGHTGPTVWAVAFSPNGSLIATGNSDRMVKVWKTSTGEELMTLRGHTGPVLDISFSPSGNRMASIGNNAKVWDVEEGTELLTLPIEWGRVIAFSPDGQYIVTGDENEIVVWDTPTGDKLRTIARVMQTSSIVFTPDGQRIITAGYGGHSIRVWDFQNGKQLMKLDGHKDNVQSLALSPDGSRLVSGSFTVAKVWDTLTGAELMTLPADGAYAVAFGSDGKTIASAGGPKAGDIILWESGPRSAVGDSD